MSDLFSAMRAAGSALEAVQNALDISQNNVSNAQTPGYVRQSAVMKAMPLELNGGLSGGVLSAGPESSRSQFAEAAVRAQQSLHGNSSQLSSSLDPIEQVFSVSANSGISSAFNTLFQAFSAWASNPSDPNGQTTVLNAATGVAAQFQQSATQLSNIRTSTEADVQSTLDNINSLTSTIRDYNVAHSQSTTPDPALDTSLNSALEQLSQLADIQVVTATNGNVTVLMGGQTPLVIGDTQNKLSLQAASGGVNPGGTPNISIVDSSGKDVTGDVSGGSLEALLSVRNQVLPGLIGGANDSGQLNLLANGMATAVNNILTAAGGKPLFSTQGSIVNAAASFSVTGGFAPGDLVAADPGPPATSNGTALKLTNLATDPTQGVQGMTFGGYYGSIASAIGYQLSQAQTSSTVQAQSLSQAQSLRQQLSGVSLDTEAMTIMQLQRSYQAASQVISVISNLTDSLIGMVQ